MKKQLTLIFTVLVLVSTATAVEIKEIEIQNTKVELNTDKTIQATIDGEGVTVEDVYIDIYENETLIVNNNQMSQYGGEDYAISYWEDKKAFQFDDYDIKYTATVNATDLNGNNDVESVTWYMTPDSIKKESTIEEQNLPFWKEWLNTDLDDLRIIHLLILLLFIGVAINQG